MIKPERKTKLLYVPHNFVLDFFRAQSLDQHHGRRPVIEGLPEPEKLRVLAVHHAWERNAFCFQLTHPSFEEVPDCVASPEIQVTWQDVDLRSEREKLVDDVIAKERARLFDVNCKVCGSPRPGHAIDGTDICTCAPCPNPIDHL